MPIPKTITIDGPAASGKTTIGSKLAEDLGYLFFDTGVMYRAVTWAALHRDAPLEDEAFLAQLAEDTDIDIQPPSVSDGRNSDILLDGEDVTWAIRQTEVDADVSQVSAYPLVRAALTRKQRKIGQRGSVVMVGRDIGTVVLPDAELKIYLDASVEERAWRRYAEKIERGEQADYDEILSAMRERDLKDASRQVAPMRPADDAVTISTDGLDIPQVLERIKELVSQYAVQS